MKYKFLFSCILALATFLLVFSFSGNKILLTILLAATSVLIFLLEFNKTTILLFLTGFILGPLSEALEIYAGIWNYSAPDFLGFPVWLPFVWGNAALFFRRVAAFLEERQTFDLPTGRN